MYKSYLDPKPNHEIVILHTYFIWDTKCEFAQVQTLDSPSSLPLHLSSFLNPASDNNPALIINPRLWANL